MVIAHGQGEGKEEISGRKSPETPGKALQGSDRWNPHPVLWDLSRSARDRSHVCYPRTQVRDSDPDSTRVFFKPTQNTVVPAHPHLPFSLSCLRRCLVGSAEESEESVQAHKKQGLAGSPLTAQQPHHQLKVHFCLAASSRAALSTSPSSPGALSLLALAPSPPWFLSQALA